ncbi:uncharacterized protein LOC144004249 isoform X2 [Festucalex cinctus]
MFEEGADKELKWHKGKEQLHTSNEESSGTRRVCGMAEWSTGGQNVGDEVTSIKLFSFAMMMMDETQAFASLYSLFMSCKLDVWRSTRSQRMTESRSFMLLKG